MPQHFKSPAHLPNNDGAPVSAAENEMLLAVLGAAAIVACLALAVALKAAF